MTTFTDFQPNALAPFQFQPTLDGAEYSAVVTWNLYAQRYYLNVYTLQQVLVVALPLVGSPAGADLVGMEWDQSLAAVLAETDGAHGYRLGATVDLTVAGVAPDGYNGQVRCLITGPASLSYPLASFPGLVTQQGKVFYNINLVAGYFSSTLVYRAPSRQFEVSP